MAHVNDVLSDRTVHKCTRLREAKCGTTVCQFCAVGCSQLAFYKDKELIEVEGDPRSPINAGRQCPKGMSTFMLNRNPYRETRALPRTRCKRMGREEHRLDARCHSRSHLGDSQ